MSPDPDPVAAHGRLAPDPAPVPRPIEECEPAAGIGADPEGLTGAPELEQARQQAVDESSPSAPHRPRSLRSEGEGHVAQDGSDLGGRWPRSRGRAGRMVQGLPADEIPEDAHPFERTCRRRSVRNEHAMVDQVAPGVGRIDEMVMVRVVAGGASVVMAAGTVSGVRHDEQIVGRAASA